MAGTASSLNAATAGSLVLYEAMQQRSAGITP
jgi:tRNA G18 (ribose-2'-O)-methylase SpoU